MKKNSLLILLFCISHSLISQNVGIGTLNPNSKLEIRADSNSNAPALRANVTFSGLADIPAIMGLSVTADGYGYGGIFEGGYYGAVGYAQGGAYAGTTYGMAGESYGSAGTRIGVYGRAQGGEENWAGYFDGRGNFTNHLYTNRNLFVTDTAYAKALHSPGPYLPLFLDAGRDLIVKIDQPDDSLFTAAFWIRNGKEQDAFGVDENGNARTFGSHYIDDNLGIGTQFPTDRLHVQDGNLKLQGLAPFQIFNTTLPTLPCGIHFNENNTLEGALYYQADLNTLNLTNNFFAPGLVLDLNTNSVRIGGTTTATGYKLSVDGKIMGEELRIMNSNIWPDYVFTESYELMSLEELDISIKKLGHLPGIPSAEEVKAEGIAVGDMQRKMMEKIEELTLYILQQEKRIRKLESSNQ